MSDVPYSYASAYDGMDYPYSKVGYPLLRAAIGPRTADDYAQLLGYPRLNPALTCRCLEAATCFLPEVLRQPGYCIY